MSNYIAYTHQLRYSSRIKYVDNDANSNTNTNTNEIITLKVRKERIYCKIIGYTPTMLKVHDVEYNKNIQKFKVADNYINSVTHGYLDKNRKMNKLDNIIYF
jgi:hypothetical protein